MGFDSGFRKVAFAGVVRPLASLAGRAVKGTLGTGMKAANKVFGGPLGTAMTAFGTANDYSAMKNKMMAAGARG